MCVTVDIIIEGDEEQIEKKKDEIEKWLKENLSVTLPDGSTGGEEIIPDIAELEHVGINWDTLE